MKKKRRKRNEYNIEVHLKVEFSLYRVYPHFYLHAYTHALYLPIYR